MNILIVKLSAVGDVIHTFPPVVAIRNRYPDAKITWLVEEAASGIVIGHGSVDRVIVSKRKQWLKQLKKGEWKATLSEIGSFFRVLRDTHYDMVFDFQAHLKSGVLISLVKADRKIGFDKGMEHQEHSHIFLNERIPPVEMDIHAVDRGMMMIEAAGIPKAEIKYNLSLPLLYKQKALNLLKNNNVSFEKPLVLIHPAAKWKTKLWRNGKFAMVADAVIQTFDAEIGFTGTDEDRGMIKDIISRINGKVHDFSGKTDLKTLAALLETADMLICTDTGPMHLSAAVETPCAAIFGPTAPWRTGPHGPMHEVVRGETPLSPCFKRQCGANPDQACRNNECMDAVTPEMVMEAVLRIFKRRESGDESAGFSENLKNETAVKNAFDDEKRAFDADFVAL